MSRSSFVFRGRGSRGNGGLGTAGCWRRPIRMLPVACRVLVAGSGLRDSVLPWSFWIPRVTGIRLVGGRRPFACICWKLGIHACREEGRGGHRIGELSSYGLLAFEHWVIRLVRSDYAAWRGRYLLKVLLDLQSMLCFTHSFK